MTQIEFLNVQIAKLSDSHRERVDDYGWAAAYLSWTIVVPIILGIIYLVDRFLITTPEINEKIAEKALFERDKKIPESKLQEHGSDIQRDLYYQAAKVRTTKTFFQSLKQAVLPVECDSDIQAWVAEAKKPETLNAPQLINKIHKRYQARIKEGRKTLLSEYEEKKLYNQYIGPDSYTRGKEESQMESYRDKYLALFQSVSPALIKTPKY